MGTIGNGVTVVVDAQNKTQGGIGAATKEVDHLSDAAKVAEKQLRDMEVKLDAADVKARKLAEAEERAGAKARDMAEKLAGLKRELAQSGDESGNLGRKIERLSVETRNAALATEDYRRKANRAAEDAREQARAYDRVADNARQAARAVAELGAASHLGKNGRGGLGGFGSALSSFSGGFLKGGFGGATSALEGTLGTPVVGPALLAGGAAAAVPAASFAGAAAGGGVLAGAGLAGAGAGLAGAWMGDPSKYSALWDKAIDGIQHRWLASSSAFGNELEDGLKIVDQTLRNIPVEKVLALSQSFVTPIATGAGQGLTAAANGFADALESVQPIIDNIGPKIGNFGAAVGDAFRMISEGSEGGSHALGDLIDAMGYAVKVAGVMVLGFENAYEGIRDFTTGLWEGTKAVPVYGDVLSGLAHGIFDINSSTQVYGRTLADTSSASGSMAQGWMDMARAGAEAALETLGLNDALTETRNTMLAMADANLAVAQGWLDLKEELKDGAKTLDSNTQAGLDNQKAILGQVEALERQRLQAIATGGNTVEATNAANAAYAAQVEALRQAAYAAGFNKQQVDALIASLGAVPPTTTATVTTPGLAESLRQGESLRQRLDAIDGRRVEANVVVYYHTQGNALNAPLRTGGIGHAAAGGAQGGLTEVGEDGPELVRLQRGTMVYPSANRNQARMMAANAAGGGVTELRVTGSGPLYEMIMAGLRSGDIQVPSHAVV